MLTFVALVLSFGFLFWYALWEREYTRKQEIAKRQRLFYWYYIFPMQVNFRKTLVLLGDKLTASMRAVGLSAVEAGKALSKFIKESGMADESVTRVNDEEN